MKIERIERKNENEFYALSANNNERILINVKTGDVTLFQGVHFIQTTIDDICNINDKIIKYLMENFNNDK